MYIYGVYELPGGVNQTHSCQTYGPAGLPGNSAVVCFGHRTAGVISLPVIFHVEEAFICMKATGLQHNSLCGLIPPAGKCVFSYAGLILWNSSLMFIFLEVDVTVCWHKTDI